MGNKYTNINLLLNTLNLLKRQYTLALYRISYISNKIIHMQNLLVCSGAWKFGMGKDNTKVSNNVSL